jgi:hypothetical protein
VDRNADGELKARLFGLREVREEACADGPDVDRHGGAALGGVLGHGAGGGGVRHGM